MSEARTARPIGPPDDSGIKYFLYLIGIDYDTRSPRLRSFHTGFFGCQLDHVERFPHRIGEGPFPPVVVTKNIYNLAPVFTMGVRLVVNRVVRDILASSCTVEFREVSISRAFWFPYGPGDDSFESAGISLEGREVDVIARFAKAYACAAPSEKYYDVIVHSSYLLSPQYADARTLRVGRGGPPESSVYVRDAVVSHRMIEEHGLVFIGGYACRPDVFDLLNPYLHRPWFWAQRYAYD